MTPVGSQVTDTRAAAPPTSSSGAVPVVAAATAATAFGELGLAGLALAGGTLGGAGWAIMRGWSDLDRAERMRPGHRFPAYGITRLITATAVLRLIADERVGIDDPANDHLRTVRLADNAVTVRELLSHAGGVDAPAPASLPPANRYAGTVPSLVSLYGPVLPCSGPRGRVSGKAPRRLRGPLAADRRCHRIGLRHGGRPAGARPARLDRLVVPGRLAARGPGRGHRLRAGTRRHLPARSRRHHRDPARGRPVDNRRRSGQVRHRVVSLLPVGLASEALWPQAGHVGLGGRLNLADGIAWEAGDGPGGGGSLIVGLSDNDACVALTNRKMPLLGLNRRVFQRAQKIPGPTAW